MVADRRQTFTVEPDDEGLRLDQIVPKRLPSLSRRKARAVIDLGGVFVDRTRVKVAGRTVRVGQVIEVNVGGAIERTGPPITPTIVFFDEHLIIADKPAGLVTAPTPESDRGDLLDQLAQQFGEVFLVHRIDLPTSGLLVFARTRDANKRLADLFKVHDVDREYVAVAVGAVEAQTIDRPVDGKRAVTHVRVIEQLSNATLIAARLETGRTHQIRLHLAGLGTPLAGDTQHGGDKSRTFIPRAPRLALHAGLLGFTHPATGKKVSFESPLPDELAKWVARLRPAPNT
ncbi:RluA family pseudouridine synthase [soil metagenome]